MKITINPEILQSEHLTMADFLVLLIGYYGINYKETLDSLIDKGVVQPNLFNRMSMVMSDNTKNHIAQILMQSDDKALYSGIDFLSLAQKLQQLYPAGIKPGTTYSWRGTTEEIAQKLRTLVVKHNFSFTEQEAIKATKDYVSYFTGSKQTMQLLKYFILKTNTSEEDIQSSFMSIIENNR